MNQGIQMVASIQSAMQLPLSGEESSRWLLVGVVVAVIGVILIIGPWKKK